jgi:hypothetical protein
VIFRAATGIVDPSYGSKDSEFELVLVLFFARAAQRFGICKLDPRSCSGRGRLFGRAETHAGTNYSGGEFSDQRTVGRKYVHSIVDFFGISQRHR